MNERNRIIFMHHEGYASYIKLAIDTAEESGNKVILLGNNQNKICCKNWMHVDDLENPEFIRFKNAYVHFSTNSFEFEFLCLKRYFIVLQYMREKQLDECIMSDTDMLIYEDMKKVDFSTYDVGLSFEGDIEVSGHFSFWTIKALENFVNYILDVYENRVKFLEEYWVNFKESDKFGGVSDMKLLFWWMKDVKDISVFNTSYINNGEMLMDPNVSTSNSYILNDFLIDRLLKIKKVKFIEGRPNFYRVKEKRWIPSFTIHAQGNAKMYMAIWARKSSNRVQLIIKKLSSKNSYWYVEKRELLDNVMIGQEKIIVYGVGADTERIYSLLKKYKNKIIYCDKRVSDGKFSFHRSEVISPNMLLEKHKDCRIVIPSRKYHDEIKKELLSLGIDKNKIY